MSMIVDTFMFYNELDILELRLMVLDEYVDKFVLVEAEVNHVGGPKELFFQKNRDRFTKWLDKIEHVIVRADEAPKEESPWSREKYQRECISKGVDRLEVPDDALIMISDVDEIPDMRVVQWERMPHVVISVHMWMYHYNLEFLFTGEPWYGTVITNAALFKRYGPNYFRDNRWKFPVFQFAGWHLSSFGDEKHVLNKMRTFAHALDNNNHKHLQTEENIRQWIQEGKFIDGKTELKRRPAEAPLPPVPMEYLISRKFINA
jgi:beta-1,4-mannosyl-glycoprotein beta-1,4-N-acetylglucosaminyltransferase